MWQLGKPGRPNLEAHQALTNVASSAMDVGKALETD